MVPTPLTNTIRGLAPLAEAVHSFMVDISERTGLEGNLLGPFKQFLQMYSREVHN